MIPVVHHEEHEGLAEYVHRDLHQYSILPNNHTGFLAFRMFSAVCCGVWLELSNQKPIRGVVCILLNTNSMYTERYKEWEGFRRSWHCRKIQKFRFSHNAYLLVFGSE